MMTTGTKEKQSGAQVLTEAMAAAILRRYQEPLEQSCADRWSGPAPIAWASTSACRT